MSEQMTEKELSDEIWYWFMIGKNKAGFPKEFVRMLAFQKGLFAILPGGPRCIQCNAPLGGMGDTDHRIRHGPASIRPYAEALQRV